MKVTPKYRVTDPKKTTSLTSRGGPSGLDLEEMAQKKRDSGVVIKGGPAAKPPPFPTGPPVRDPDEPEHREMTDTQLINLRERVWRQVVVRMVGAKEAKRMEDEARRQQAAKRALRAWARSPVAQSRKTQR